MMKTYVRLAQIDGMQTVVEIIVPPTADGVQVEVATMYTPEFVAALIDVSTMSPQPEQWWTYDGTSFTAPVLG